MPNALTQMRRLILRLLSWAAFLIGSLSSGACRDARSSLTDASTAYYSARYRRAEEILKPWVEFIEQRQFRVRITAPELRWIQRELRLPPTPAAALAPEELTEMSREYFSGWMLYAGSLFGQQRVREGCQAARQALRELWVEFVSISGSPLASHSISARNLTRLGREPQELLTLKQLAREFGCRFSAVPAH